MGLRHTTKCCFQGRGCIKESTLNAIELTLFRLNIFWTGCHWQRLHSLYCQRKYNQSRHVAAACYSLILACEAMFGKCLAIDSSDIATCQLDSRFHVIFALSLGIVLRRWICEEIRNCEKKKIGLREISLFFISWD